MLTNQAIYNDLLGYLGIEPGNGAPDTDQRILQDINAALQDIYTNGPDYIRRQRQTARYQAPWQVQIGVTTGSNVTTGTAFTAAQIGCLIRIDGEDVDNEVTGPNSLLNSIVGTTRTASGTVYCDSVTLPANCIGVEGNCFLDDTARELQPLKFQDKTLFKENPTWAIDPYYVTRSTTFIRSRIGFPEGYYLENCQINTGSTFGLRMRIWPVPQMPYAVKFMGIMVAPSLALADLEIGAGTPTKTTPIPGNLHETTLLPLARKRLSSYPHFLAEKRPLVLEEAAQALTNLESISPQPQTGAKLRVPYRAPR